MHNDIDPQNNSQMMVDSIRKANLHEIPEKLRPAPQ
jgi:hypothetical protein